MRETLEFESRIERNEKKWRIGEEGRDQESVDKTGLAFIYAGVVGVMITLGVIRSMLYRLVGRKLYISAFLLILTAILGGIGWQREMIIEAMVLATLFFIAVAYLDYKNFFERVSNEKLRKTE